MEDRSTARRPVRLADADELDELVAAEELVLFEDGRPVGRLAEGFQGVEAVPEFVDGSRR